MQEQHTLTPLLSTSFLCKRAQTTHSRTLDLTKDIWNHAGVQTSNVFFPTKTFRWLNLVDITVVLIGFGNLWKSKKNMLWESNAARILTVSAIF